MKEDIKAFYFPHDIGASNDPKLVDLRMRFGWEAIGMYWAIIEALHKEKDGSMSSHLISSMILDFYSQEEIRTMSHKRDHAKELEECFYTNVLLEKHNGITTNKRVRKNIEERHKKSELARKSIEARWHKDIKNKDLHNSTNELRTNYERNTIKERKGKESKYIKDSNTCANAHPPKEEVLKYFSELGKSEEIGLSYYDHFSSNGWKVGGRATMKDWRAAARNWARNSEKFNKEKPKVYGYTKDRQPITDLQVAKIMGLT